MCKRAPAPYSIYKLRGKVEHKSLMAGPRRFINGCYFTRPRVRTLQMYSTRDIEKRVWADSRFLYTVQQQAFSYIDFKEMRFASALL